jgi:hypothetical protein
MQDTLSEKIRIATQDLRLTDDSQRKIVAHRLTRALLKVDAEKISVEELRQLISRALVGVPGVVSYAVKPVKQEQKPKQAPDQPVVAAEKPAVVEVGDDAYRRNDVVKQVGNG